MKTPPPKLSDLLRNWRKLRRELADLRDNPSPRTDPLKAFCTAMRPPIDDKLEPPASEI
jgi:hypothetical protein